MTLLLCLLSLGALVIVAFATVAAVCVFLAVVARTVLVVAAILVELRAQRSDRAVARARDRYSNALRRWW